MAEKGVMTTKEFAMEKSARAKEQEKVEKKKTKPKSIATTDKYRFSPMGEVNGNVAFFHKDEKYKLKVIKGCFKIPRDWNPVKKQQYRKMLLEVGFDLVPTEATPAMKKAKNIEFSVMHPDHSEYDPVDVPYEVRVGKKMVKVNVKRGIVHTRDEKVKDALLKQGFVEYTAPDGKDGTTG